jgi:hypothetical protein
VISLSGLSKGRTSAVSLGSVKMLGSSREIGQGTLEAGLFKRDGMLVKIEGEDTIN